MELTNKFKGNKLLRGYILSILLAMVYEYGLTVLQYLFKNNLLQDYNSERDYI